MEQTNKKDNLLLTIVGENNNLEMRLKKAKPEEKEIWGAAFTRLIALGKEVIKYSKHLTEDELGDFRNLYRTAAFVHDPKKADALERKRASDQFVSIIIGAEDFLHRIILPTIPNENIVALHRDIEERINDLTFSINYLDINFIFVENAIERLLNANQDNLTEEKQAARAKLKREFNKLKELSKYTKEYFASVKAIIDKFINEYSTEQELNDCIAQLKEINRMITYIESSFNTKRIERVTTNNEQLSEMLSSKEGSFKL